MLFFAKSNYIFLSGSWHFIEKLKLPSHNALWKKVHLNAPTPKRNRNFRGDFMARVTAKSRRGNVQGCLLIYHRSDRYFFPIRPSLAANKVIKSQIVAAWRLAPIMIYRQRGPSNWCLIYFFDFLSKLLKYVWFRTL